MILSRKQQAPAEMAEVQTVIAAVSAKFSGSVFSFTSCAHLFAEITARGYISSCLELAVKRLHANRQYLIQLQLLTSHVCHRALGTPSASYFGRLQKPHRTSYSLSSRLSHTTPTRAVEQIIQRP
jgi:hypothetical protein